ncbi:MAG: hypothetical protein ABIQ33_14370 [Caldimonas sp.]
MLQAHSVDQLQLVGERNAALMNVLASLEYDAFRLRKDATSANVIAIQPILEFPHEVYRRDSQSVCYYLFAPRKLVSEVTEAFGTAKGALGRQSRPARERCEGSSTPLICRPLGDLVPPKGSAVGRERVCAGLDAFGSGVLIEWEHRIQAS